MPDPGPPTIIILVIAMAFTGMPRHRSLVRFMEGTEHVRMAEVASLAAVCLALVFGLAAGGLLGFEHEAAALVAIDIELGAGAVGVAIIETSLEDVIVTSRSPPGPMALALP